MSNITLVGWVASGDDRGTIDILWSCCVVMILCVWASTSPNVPSRKDRWFHHIIDKLNLMLIGYLGPDLLCGIAIGQLASARRSVKQFKNCNKLSGDQKWTIRKAFFADMGGFILTSPDYPEGFPINAEQLFYLVDNGHLSFPELSEEDIKEKSKVDTLSKIITSWQVLWFTISESARVAHGYSITPMELTTLTFSTMMFISSMVWYYKPSISRPVELKTKNDRTILQIREIARQTTHPDISTNWYRTPLYFLSRRPFHVELSWAYYSELTHMVHMPLFNRQITETPWDRFPSDTFLDISGSLKIMLPGILLFQVPFAVSFFASWSRHFPTRAEQTIWRICAVYHAVYTLFMTAYFVSHSGPSGHFHQEKIQPLKTNFGRYATHLLDKLKIVEHKLGRRQRAEIEGDVSSEEVLYSSWSYDSMIPKRLRSTGSALSNWLKPWRNISSNQDPDMEVRFRWIIPSWTMALLYIWCRLFFYIEDFISLRQQPADVYIALNQFIPFIA